MLFAFSPLGRIFGLHLGLVLKTTDASYSSSQAGLSTVDKNENEILGVELKDWSHEQTDGPMDQQTDGPTGRQTDRMEHAERRRNASKAR